MRLFATIVVSSSTIRRRWTKTTTQEQWGEHSFNTPTKDESKIKTGSKGNGLGSYIGKPGEAKEGGNFSVTLILRVRRTCTRWRKLTMDAAKDLAGKDNAMKAKKVITLATVPLQGDKAEALEQVAENADIVFAKNSVCRKKTRGGSTQNNEKLLALACLKALPRTNG